MYRVHCSISSFLSKNVKTTPLRQSPRKHICTPTGGPNVPGASKRNLKCEMILSTSYYCDYINHSFIMCDYHFLLILHSTGANIFTITVSV